jgi:DNA-binding LacI/PurR family transcriptional regulator
MATLAEIARHAGVSPSTVSYVLSGKRPISDATRQRVQQSIVALGYYPHAGARALASSRSDIVALVVPFRPDMHVPVLMEIATAVATTSRRHSRDVLLLTSDEGVASLHRVTGSALADALIVMDVELRDERIPELRQLLVPSVLIGVPEDTTGLTCIDLDFHAAGAACVDYLADQGHGEVALIGPPSGVYRRGTGFAHRTLRGVRATARRRGVRVARCPCDNRYEAAYRTITLLLQSRPGLTGLVVQNEPVIAPLLAALRAAGRDVPGDVSIVAICSDAVVEQASPRLTSVAIPAEEMGRRAVELVAAKLEGQPVPEATLLQPRLTVRDSSGPPTHPQRSALRAPVSMP